jgi:hypothetical protein
MAFTSWITNQIPGSGGEALFKFMTMLEGAGWTIQESSDGSSYAAGNASFTSGYNNSQAWFRASIPGGVSELCVQRGSGSDRHAWIKYSRSATFNTSPSGNTMPTASDEINLFGTSSGGDELFASSGTYYLQGGADDNISAGDGYGFWMACYRFGGQPTTAIVMDPLVGTDSNDTATGERYAFFIGRADDCFSKNYLASYFPSSNQPECKAFLGSPATFVEIPASYYQVYNSGLPSGSNVYSGKDDRLPLVLIRHSSLGSPIGYKGVSSMMMWELNIRSSTQTKGNKTRISFGDISLPWDGTTTPRL